jgi:hypothetical protein
MTDTIFNLENLINQQMSNYLKSLEELKQSIEEYVSSQGKYVFPISDIIKPILINNLNYFRPMTESVNLIQRIKEIITYINTEGMVRLIDLGTILQIMTIVLDKYMDMYGITQEYKGKSSDEMLLSYREKMKEVNSVIEYLKKL